MIAPEMEKFYVTLAMAGEAGELANLVKKEWRDGVDKKEEIRMEAADVAIYLTRLTRLYGFDLNEAVREKEAINRDRFGKASY